MFWRFGNPSTLDALLDRDASLVEVLDDPDVLQEVRAKNVKLIDFLCRHEHAEQLLRYVTRHHEHLADATRPAVATPNPTNEIAPAIDPPAPTIGSASNSSAVSTENVSGTAAFMAMMPYSSSTGSDGSDDDEITPTNTSATADAANGHGSVSPEVSAQMLVKFPVIVAEIFASDAVELIQVVLASQELRKDLLSVLDRAAADEVQRDCTQVGLWTQILSQFLLRQTLATLQWLNTEPNLIERLLPLAMRHACVLDLAVRMIGLQDCPEGRQFGVATWLQKQGLVTHLVSYLDPTRVADQGETAYLAATALVDLVQIVQGSTSTARMNAHPLIADLRSPATAARLVGYLVAAKSYPAGSRVVPHIAQVLIELLRRNAVELAPLSIPPSPLTSTLGTSSHGGDPDQGPRGAAHRNVPMDLSAIVRELCASLPAIQRMLVTEEPGSGDALPGTGARLGLARLRLCELLSEMLRCALSEPFMDVDDLGPLQDMSKDMRLALDSTTSTAAPAIDASVTGEPLRDLLRQTFLDTRVLVTCMDLFFAHPWNNLVHGIVYDLVLQVAGGPWTTCRSAFVHLVRDGTLLARLVAAHHASVAAQQKPKGGRLGYMGHVTLLTEIVGMTLDRDPTLRDELAGILADPLWDEYVNGAFQVAHARDQGSPLAGLVSVPGTPSTVPTVGGVTDDEHSMTFGFPATAGAQFSVGDDEEGAGSGAGASASSGMVDTQDDFLAWAQARTVS
ncbi:hypothetical protein AMAG_09076 [Allomyces macrogynus ATCC 38327]|uniref:SAPS-domain-containing protein n=1 Tax=Allomyces macrogynus (strain ATCC 38327) TaxID=578462 RepID=A0A0L0SNE8_ALLM3|nr:hypothetical protein AMAG_09076 [Allomyces macrogynus ATCC 38327]|eukprot:KNE64017.1 hypothetical protein AMAG_09076 [Allomyces macrogynus ATCC 38327]